MCRGRTIRHCRAQAADPGAIRLTKTPPRTLRNAHWKWARALVLLIGSILILTLLVRSVGLDRFLQELRGAHVPLVLAAAGAYLLELVVRWIRWLVLFDHPRRGPALAVWMIGTGVNELAPSGTGEVVRGVVAYERYGIPFARVLAPTAVERLSDLLLLLALAAYTIIALVTPVSALAIAVPVLLVGIGLSVLVRPSLLSLVGRRLRAHRGLAGRVGNLLEGLSADLHVLARRRAALVGALGLTLAVWGLEGAAQWAMLRALGVDLDLAVVLGFTAVAFLAGFVSFLPGGLGSREAALTGLLVAAGAGSAPAAAATVTLRAGQTLLVLLLGGGAALAASINGGDKKAQTPSPQASSGGRPGPSGKAAASREPVETERPGP